MPPITKAQIPALYQKALALQNAGKLPEALAQYEAIARLNPNISEVHFQVARIFATAGQFKKALPHAKTAARLKPKQAAPWILWAEVMLGLADKEKQAQAQDDFQKALRRAALPGPARARIRKMIQAANTPDESMDTADRGLRDKLPELREMLADGRAEIAMKTARKLLKTHPRSVSLLEVIAQAQNIGGAPAMALKTYGKALDLAPGSAMLHNGLGWLLLEMGQPMRASEEFRRATRLDPEFAPAWAGLGCALGQIEQQDEGLILLVKACEMDPKLSEAHLQRGILLAALKRDAEAVTAFETAIALDHDDAPTLTLLARAQVNLRRETEAMANFEKAIAKQPEYAFAYARRAALLQTQGDFTGAEADFRKAIALAPETAETYRIFGASHKFSADDPLLAQMETLWKRGDLSDKARRDLGFALAKAMEDSKQYDRVFSYLNPANELMRKEFPHSQSAREELLEKIRAAFDGVDFDAYEDVGDTSFAPIFVTGMPRSGTTLVEQILASHSSVTAGGEVGKFTAITLEKIARMKGAFRKVINLSADEITGFGRDYTACMHSLFPGADRITDKSIQTYSMMGLVKLALPRARVVVVRRDPRDNLLSIYKNVFHEGAHRYAYNLEDLGHYYKEFARMIDFWRARLPGYFHEISYDALTANPEAEARKLLAACDLEWEDACLNFHQNTNRVDTLSVYQVRQPIYRSSVKAWQRYEKDLAPLFEALK